MPSVYIIASFGRKNSHIIEVSECVFPMFWSIIITFSEAYSVRISSHKHGIECSSNIDYAYDLDHTLTEMFSVKRWLKWKCIIVA